MSKIICAALCLLFLLPSKTFAWGPTGHRIVGEIAWKYLTPKAKQQVQKILSNESLAISSNWADFIKSDKAYDYLSPWHYINIQAGLSENSFYTALKNDTATDIYTKLQFTIKQLRNKSLGLSQKRMYLRLLIHLVGDAHQPMHVSRAEDLGGNKIYVMWFKDSSNLHRMWDEDLIDFQKLSYTEYTNAIDYITRQQVAQWQSANVKQWLYESYTISTQLYSEIKYPYQRLSYRYNYDHIATLNKQLLKAGIRLAGVLNNIYK